MSLGLYPGKLSYAIIRAAWRRQGGQCARCGVRLIVANQDRGEVGAWHAHPRFRELGYEFEDNCTLLCINPPRNCHITAGHAYGNNRLYQPLEDFDLPYFYAGTRRKTPSPEFKRVLDNLRRSPNWPDRYLPP